MKPLVSFVTAAAVAAAVGVTFTVPARADWRQDRTTYGRWDRGTGYSHHNRHYYGRHHHGEGLAAAIILGALIGMAVDKQASANYYYPAPPRVVYRTPPPRVVYGRPTPAYPAPPPAVVSQAPTVASITPSACVMTREYQTTVTIGGKPRKAYGTACLRPDGSWLQGPAKLVPQF
jgi:hypothetical protein